MFSSFKIEQHPFKRQVSNTLPFFNSLLLLIRFVVVFSCFVFFPARFSRCSMEVETVTQRRHPSGITRAASHAALPSYTALKPCALTAKSVVNHKASIDPLLTIGEGSMNPDNLRNKQTRGKKGTCSKLNDDKASLTSHIDRSLAHARKQDCWQGCGHTRLKWSTIKKNKKWKIQKKNTALAKKEVW